MLYWCYFFHFPLFKVAANSSNDAITTFEDLKSAITSATGTEDSPVKIYISGMIEQNEKLIINDGQYIHLIGADHKVVKDAAVAPTCHESGLTEGKHCSLCNIVLVEQEVVEPIGHSYNDNWCSNDTHHWRECSCGEKTDMNEHIYDDDRDASCNVCNRYRTISSKPTPKPQSGCGGSIVSSIIATAALLGTTLVLRKKREE